MAKCEKWRVEKVRSRCYLFKIRGKHFILIRGRGQYDNTHKKSYKAERDEGRDTKSETESWTTESMCTDLKVRSMCISGRFLFRASSPVWYWCSRALYS